MSLTTLWKKQKGLLENKHVKQIISFAGDGKLCDENLTSREFRQFLSLIPSKQLLQYWQDCLAEPFDGREPVMQDLVNQIGRRLGFRVSDLPYRQPSRPCGPDGLWETPDNRQIIVELATAGAERIDLAGFALDRGELIDCNQASEDASSILIVVEKDDCDTCDLEAQIRGSRYAWKIRLIGANALVRLMKLKEEIEDPAVIEYLSSILIPREFTRLDEIVDLISSAVADAREDLLIGQEPPPAAFREACVERLERLIGQPLVKRSRAAYSSSDETVKVTCEISEGCAQGELVHYRFAFHPHQNDFLDAAEKGYAAFGCGGADRLLAIPFDQFQGWLPSLPTMESDRRFYWSVIIGQEKGSFFLYRRNGNPRIDLNEYLLG